MRLFVFEGILNLLNRKLWLSEQGETRFARERVREIDRDSERR
jgi:hypothetical protein